MTKSAFPDICFGSIWYKLLTFNTAVSIQRPYLWGAALSRRGARCHLEVIRYFHFRLSCFWECVLDSKNEYHCLTASGVFFLQSPLFLFYETSSRRCFGQVSLYPTTPDDDTIERQRKKTDSNASRGNRTSKYTSTLSCVLPPDMSFPPHLSLLHWYGFCWFFYIKHKPRNQIQT